MIRREHVAPVLLAYFFLTGIVYAGGNLDPNPNTSAAPEFELRDLDNQLHRLSEYKSKVVLVNFWASWCIPCLREMPGMQRLADHFKDRPFEILAVNVSEQRARVTHQAKRINADFTILLDEDGETFKRWQARIFPTSFIIDPDGKIRYQAVGPLEWDSDEVISTIRELMPQ